AFVLINAMWWLDRSPPAAFATLGIVIFLAHCSLFYHTPQRSHRSVVLGYMVLALIMLGVQLGFKPHFWTHLPPSNDEWPLLSVGFVLIVIGIATIVLILRRPARYATAQAARNAYIDESLQPWNILRHMWPFSRLFPPPPPQIQDDDHNALPGNPDPG